MSPRLAVRLLTPAALALVLSACGGRDRPEPEGAATGPPAGREAPREEEEPLDRVPVTIWFPSATSEGLAGEAREILATISPVDRAKQILSELISGPQGGAALPAVPGETRLRQVFVLGDGTAWADFSADLLEVTRGGSEDEIRALYAIVDSLVLNVPEIRRVGILVEGKPCEGRGGHLDLSRPLPPDRSLLEAETPETPAEEPSPPEGGAPRDAEPGDAAGVV